MNPETRRKLVALITDLLDNHNPTDEEIADAIMDNFVMRPRIRPLVKAGEKLKPAKKVAPKKKWGRRRLLIEECLRAGLTYKETYEYIKASGVNTTMGSISTYYYIIRNELRAEGEQV